MPGRPLVTRTTRRGLLDHLFPGLTLRPRGELARMQNRQAFARGFWRAVALLALLNAALLWSVVWLLRRPITPGWSGLLTATCAVLAVAWFVLLGLLAYRWKLWRSG